MKVIVQTEFLCSYYYHAAKEACGEIRNHQLPHSLYQGISALILWQCMFESYANFQIRRHKLDEYRFLRRHGQPVSLKQASIKEKWMHLPIARNQKPFVVNTEPFTEFAALVDIRNDPDPLLMRRPWSFEKDAPPGTKTVR